MKKFLEYLPGALFGAFLIGMLWVSENVVNVGI